MGLPLRVFERLARFARSPTNHSNLSLRLFLLRSFTLNNPLVFSISIKPIATPSLSSSEAICRYLLLLTKRVSFEKNQKKTARFTSAQTMRCYATRHQSITKRDQLNMPRSFPCGCSNGSLASLARLRTVEMIGALSITNGSRTLSAATAPLLSSP